MKRNVERLRQELEETGQQLADLRSRFDDAQQVANMGDFDWHIESDESSWSDQLYRIYGYQPQEFNASYDRFLSMVHPDDRDAVTATHRRVYETGGAWSMVERIVRPDGEVRHLATNGEVVKDEDGTPVRLRGTCVDITDRLRAENVVQGISAARLALQMGDVDSVAAFLDRTLQAARAMTAGDLVLNRSDDPDERGMVRSAARSRQT
ncbi:PAS domain-containing protein [Nocardioides bizhenqiangii]|uniref:histidine kinase n=1 Tax=Nocardioides bizhenqiangii TaxID=3095076 RepID=A0ABZ0ZL56_9ACTN|nr:PAS domain-containing protein [Nocardioides sp. HM61]WQQ24496.1 PAS domain-containing protein [Nocardioides sp. HM61]